MSTNCTCNHCTQDYCASKVSLFSNLNPTQIQEIIKKIQHIDIKKGEIILSEGAVSNRLYIINKGSLKVYNYNKEGKEQIFYILSEGDFLGDLNLFKEDVFEYYAQALEDTYLCTLSRDDFMSILKDNPEINQKILDYAYERITSLEHLIQTLNSKDVNARLASLLINISKHFGITTKEGVEISLPLSREDMANYLGLTRETVSRHLSHLQHDNIIQLIGSKKVVIKNFNELKNLSL
ncbi:Crp/Fnr family transcriptional regulator [Natranaerovirga hydrolytica]|uniref:Crp/Fnr family transcriptional regulator n=1 Tax=Natranaerovirga hydrolytica TaxID=680378 RepID=A0A4R1MFL3_9FIRM|nr:Crp/Fnr family transcriptional regulator [Natranaerovirga hydrolytica]TCK90510.1 Crp/Fnr family transcriptional regulator [Natranaerovirga hydrolytica]